MLITSLDFDLDLFLGVSAAERKTSQKIVIAFSMLYKTIPEAIHLNSSNEYICYQDIAAKLYAKFNDNEIKLLEHLAYTVYLEIRKITKDRAMINVSVKKVCPYIAGNSLGTAQCEYKEF